MSSLKIYFDNFEIFKKYLKNLKIILRKFEKILQKLREKLIKFCCTTMPNCRPKIIVYISCIEVLGSCMYRYTRYTTFSFIVFRTMVKICGSGAKFGSLCQNFCIHFVLSIFSSHIIWLFGQNSLESGHPCSVQYKALSLVSIG